MSAVRGTQALKVNDMPGFVRTKKLWDPAVCLAFTDQLLAFVRKMVHRDYKAVCLLVAFVQKGMEP
jgi:hypothetical protein